MKCAITYWVEADGTHLGYLNEYPDHWTQGENFDDLKANLADLYQLFTGERIPGIRRVVEIEVS